MKWIWTILWMLMIPITVLGQVNVSEYTDVLNGYYTGVDSQYQLHNEIKTIADENYHINRLFPFHTNQVSNSANAIHFYDTLIPKASVDFPYYISWGNASNYYKAQQLSFTINQDTGYAFCYKNNAIHSSPNTAYIIIPGSGINQATGIAIYNPANYHNAVCTVAQTCRQYGDVYTYVRPNEDFAALWTTVSPGVRRKMNYEALTSKTNLLNKNWAANCYIQINALVKYLQTKYDKVVVLGLSSGAWGAMFSTLQTEPDAALMASGYSISFHDLTYTYNFDQMHYDGLFSSHPIDSVRNRIKAMNTQFLFSYGSNDQVTHMEDEHDNHTSENYFNTPSPLDNTSYFYNFSLHRFPCEAMDTFFTRIQKMPKVRIAKNNICTSDSLIFNLQFIGTPPFQGMLYRNDIPYYSFNTIEDTLSVTVFDEGEYQIKNLIDSNQIIGFKSTKIEYIKETKLQIGTVTKQYVCQSDSALIHIPITGTLPYKITLLHYVNGWTDTLIANNTNFSFYRKNGNYSVIQVSDSNNCLWQQGQLFSVNYKPLNATIDAPIFDCDSNKNKLTFHLNGNPPWNINLYKSGYPNTIIQTDSVHTYWFENGQYLFNQVSDLTGCTLNTNNFFNLNGTPIQASASLPIYNCDSNKTQLSLSAQGNTPFSLFYKLNNTPQQVSWQGNSSAIYLNNGQYELEYIQDVTGCIDSLNSNYTFDYDSINYQIDLPVYNCDSNKTAITFHVKGNAPWIISYLKNGNSQTTTIYDSIATLYFNNGLYVFQEISDQTGCSKPINEVFTFSYQPLTALTSNPTYNCLANQTEIQFNITGNPPYILNYSSNGTPNSLTLNNNFVLFPNGNYNLYNITDNTGCISQLYTNFNAQFDSLQFQFNTPIYNCDSNKTQLAVSVQGNAPWVLHYTFNGVSQQTVLTQNNTDLFFNNGLYQFVDVVDSTGCSVAINQSFNFQYQPLSWNLVQQSYNCDSNLYKTEWAFTGNAPWTIQYTFNGGSVSTQTFTNVLSNWYLPNGQYQLVSLNDATSCQQSINMPLALNFVPVGVSLSTPLYNCDSNKTQLAISVQGNAPWVLHYTFNGASQQTVLTQNNTDLFFINGLYQFLDVVDSTGCSVAINQSFNFQYQPLSWNLVQQSYNCDSNLYKTEWAFTGNAPWTIQYTINGGPVLNQTFNNASSNWYLPNGQYQLVSINDATSCQQSINMPLTLNFVPVGVSLSTPLYNCDSNKTQLAVSVQGNAPWVLHYTFNGASQQTVLTQNNTDLFFINGLYQFLDVVDSTGCSVAINQSFNFQYQPLSWNLVQQSYNCDSNLYKVQWAFTGNAPWVLTYELVGGFVYTKIYSTPVADLYLPNGQWHILSISDATGCVQAINIPLNVNFTALSVSTTPPQYDCDSNKMKVAFNIQGNEPFTFQVNQLSNNTTQWLSSSLNNPSFWWPIGQYLVQQVTDATGCVKPINQYINHNILPLSYQALARQFDCDSQKVRYPFVWQGNAPWILSYRDLSNGFVYSKTYNQANASLWLATGQYALLSITDAYCSMPMNDTLIVNFPTLNAQLATPGIQCDSNKAAIVVNLQSGLAPVYLQWVYNGVPDSLLLHAGQQTQLLPNGSYYFNQLRDSTNCVLPINQSYTANYTPLTWNSWQRKYNCALDTNDITFNINGANNTGLFYTRNGIADTLVLQQGANAIQWGRGQYHLAYLRDTAQCILPIDTTFSINDVPLALDVANLHPICIDKVHEYTFNVKGKAPWVIEYNYGNVTQTINLPDSSNRWICAPGRYDFVQISDDNQCELSLTRIDSLPSFIPYDPVLSTDYKTIQIDPSNLPIQWWYNQLLMDSTKYNGSIIRHIGEGNYQASVIDNAQCTWYSNIINLQFDNQIALYPNPTSNEIGLLVQDVFGEYWTWQITNSLGQVLATRKIETPFDIINVREWAPGAYSVRIIYQNSPNPRMARFIKQ